MHCGFFTDGDDGEHTTGATPFFGGENQAKHDDLQRAQGNGRIVEQTWPPGVYQTMNQPS